ncbi:response regulator [Knoellia subterranea]|uniref:LuxR family transcriptional regulator n=1 Tax=Knoellia subterranea KCTC 19937 TaxID=1385521 RepID=A0A0A0JPG0_9MICO|nr:response regulator transcription factor [Knoellia subterranea]KGN39003.1 LuxR family transcriptional regulator [Knoellia subterranea KCTC 19937]
MTTPTANHPQEPIRVVIVDDHPVVRSGMHTLLAASPCIEVVGESSNGDEVLTMVENTSPDVVLTDLRLGPGGDGVDVTKAVRGAHPDVAVLIITTFDHDADIVRAVEAGAAGYLLKDALPDEIVAAIRAAAQGETVLSAEQSQRVIDTLRVGGRPPSERELDVLRLVADGRSNDEIAKALFISRATVKTHLGHLFDKLDVDSRTGAVATARRLGLID